MEQHERYHISLAAMNDVFCKMPWSFAPLTNSSLRAYGSCFLSPDEMNTLGLEGDADP